MLKSNRQAIILSNICYERQPLSIIPIHPTLLYHQPLLEIQMTTVYHSYTGCPRSRASCNNFVFLLFFFHHIIICLFFHVSNVEGEQFEHLI